METYRFSNRINESHEYILLLSGACKRGEKKNPFVRDSIGAMDSGMKEVFYSPLA